MTAAERRRTSGCLAPVVIDRVVDDPDSVRALARENGPYDMPERPGGYVWPNWHTAWALEGDLLLDEAAPLLRHEGLATAARAMCGGGTVTPWGLNVNLSTPCPSQPVSHTDMPQFAGLDRDAAPGWFFQVMGASGLFEKARITTITAVAWFYAGEAGYFRYWPNGRDEPSVRHEAMWGSAVVGDNDFMHHKVERVGAREASTPSTMTGTATLDFDGDQWFIADNREVIARFAEPDVRFSLSWTGRVEQAGAEPTPVSLDEVYERMASAVGPTLLASSVADLFSDASRAQLHERWPGYLPTRPGGD